MMKTPCHFLKLSPSDLVSNSKCDAMPSHIPASQSSKVVVRTTSVLRDLGAFVTFKTCSVFGRSEMERDVQRKEEETKTVAVGVNPTQAISRFNS